ncbi:hypothetical protein GGS21DRAFT_419740 [Xylaria nigripes]|nr:hypothetical protein GGS21DRAFT_419740 [Xylaria nigripes]
MPPFLRHLFLQSRSSVVLPQFPSYAFAELVQTMYQQALLDWKARPLNARGPTPPPTVLCFTPSPTYTLGRRQTEPLSESEIARLQSPLFLLGSGASERWAVSGQSASRDVIGKHEKTAFFLPTISHAPRGGLTTYHGPGQLVIWPIIDLRSPLHAHFSVRDYACLLEKTTIATLEKRWGIKGFTTENPGVWVRSSDSQSGGADERKIAALGVHLRRHVTGLGVSINYNMPVAGPPEINPWSRIVACGLGDRRVTSVCAELGTNNGTIPADADQELASLAQTWWIEFDKRLKMHAVAEDMVRESNPDQDMADLNALARLRDDYAVRAYPISSLDP